MSFLRLTSRDVQSNLERQARRGEQLKFVWAVTLVAAGLLARFVLQPVFGASHTYTAFYPVVLLAAYSLGARPAILAMILSSAVAYWCFAAPPFQFKLTAQALMSMGFFLGTSGVAILLISGLTRALAELARRQDRAEALADNHARLFQELNSRVTHHLQLVGGLLALQARGETDVALSGALTRASERSIDLSRTHSELAGQADDAVDFKAFAASLAKSAPARMEITGVPLMLPRGQATSLGVALLECVEALARRRSGLNLRIDIAGERGQARLRIGEVETTGGISTASLADAYLLRAMVEQLGGRLRLSTSIDGPVLDITFPLRGPAREDEERPSKGEPARTAATVH